MKVWLCVNRQTREKRLLVESEAFELDIRLWDLKDWNCTSGHEQEALPKYPLSIVRPGKEYAPAVIKCESCEGYHFGSDKQCRRPVHVRYDLLEETS